MAGGGVGAMVEALGILLNLLECFAVLLEVGVGLVKQEEVIVPFAECFLGGFVASGEGGGGFGGVDAGLGEVACGLGGFAESVEILIVLRVEAADGFGEPALGDGDELCAAEVEVERGTEMGFEVVEPEFDFLLLLLEAFDEFALGFFSDGGEVLRGDAGRRECDRRRLRDRSGRRRRGLRLLRGAVCGENAGEVWLVLSMPEISAERARSSRVASMRRVVERRQMDAFGRGLFEAVCDGCLEHQALTEKDGDGLRHDFTLR